LSQHHSISKESLVIVLCHAASMPAYVRSIAGRRNFELVTMPIGPYKLGKAIRCGLIRSEAGASLIHKTTQSSTTDAVAQSMGRIKLVHADDGRAHDLTLPKLPIVAGNGQTGFGSPVSQPPFQVNVQLTELKTELQQHATTKAQHPRLPSPTATTLFDEVTRMITTVPVQADGTGMDQQQKSCRPPRILLVDDNHVNLRLINMFMRKRSYESVHLAQNGKEAVTIYKDLILQDPPLPPDIVFMGKHLMPGHNPYKTPDNLAARH